MIKKFFKKVLIKENELSDQFKNKKNIINIIALLIEASSVDGSIQDEETTRIRELILKYFTLDKETIKEYYNEALLKQKESISYYDFTSKIHKTYGYEEKIQILEMLWEVILVDNQQDDFELNLMRRVCGLLYISDIDCGNAKKRVVQRLK